MAEPAVDGRAKPTRGSPLWRRSFRERRPRYFQVRARFDLVLGEARELSGAPTARRASRNRPRPECAPKEVARNCGGARSPWGRRRRFSTRSAPSRRRQGLPGPRRRRKPPAGRREDPGRHNAHGPVEMRSTPRLPHTRSHAQTNRAATPPHPFPSRRKARERPYGYRLLGLRAGYRGQENARPDLGRGRARPAELAPFSLAEKVARSAG